MRSLFPTGPLIAGAVITSLALGGCAGASHTDNHAEDDTDGLVQVVASTDVYGDIAERIGGGTVEVTSLIDDPSQDPHSFEASARQQLALSKADVVIENGGGYDDFVDTMLDGVDNGNAELLAASEISGYNQEPAVGEFNEHLWYDFPTMAKLANQLVGTLSRLDEANATAYRANGDVFITALHGFETIEAEMKTRFEGTGVAVTEPVPLYLLEACGLENMTPTGFSEAIDGGTDVSPAVLNDTLNLFASGDVKLLVYNGQTSSPETEQLRAAAADGDVPVVSVTETLPEGEDYLSWMSGNLDAIAGALA